MMSAHKQILYLTVMENTFNNNIHVNQVYPILNTVKNIHGLFINPILEVSRQRFGLVRNRKKINNATIIYSPFPTYFYFCHWFIMPFMVLYACIAIVAICFQKKIDIIHCRNLMSGVCGILVRKLLRVAVVVDIRGVHAEEGVLIGRWRQGSISYRIQKLIEVWVATSADEILCISPNLCTYIDSLAPGVASHYVPAMVNTKSITYDHQIRLQARMELKLKENDLCLIYVGTLGPWHTIDALKEQIAALRLNPQKGHICIIILTKHDPTHILSELEHMGAVTVKSVQPDEVSYYLNAADVGLLPGKPIESESDRIMFDIMISSKAEEYLCTGLPVVANNAIGFFRHSSKNHFENKTRKQLAEHYQKQFSSDVVIEKISQIYRSIK